MRLGVRWFGISGEAKVGFGIRAAELDICDHSPFARISSERAPTTQSYPVVHPARSIHDNSHDVWLGMELHDPTGYFAPRVQRWLLRGLKLYYTGNWYLEPSGLYTMCLSAGMGLFHWRLEEFLSAHLTVGLNTSPHYAEPFLGGLPQKPQSYLCFGTPPCLDLNLGKACMGLSAGATLDLQLQKPEPSAVSNSCKMRGMVSTYGQVSIGTTTRRLALGGVQEIFKKQAT